jgi:hypothetical protein
MEVELHLSSTACQNSDMQQGETEDNEASLEENSTGNYMDYKKVADWEKTLVVYCLSSVDIQGSLPKSQDDLLWAVAVVKTYQAFYQE